MIKKILKIIIGISELLYIIKKRKTINNYY